MEHLHAETDSCPHDSARVHYWVVNRGGARRDSAPVPCQEPLARRDRARVVRVLAPPAGWGGTAGMGWYRGRGVVPRAWGGTAGVGRYCGRGVLCPKVQTISREMGVLGRFWSRWSALWAIVPGIALELGLGVVPGRPRVDVAGLTELRGRADVVCTAVVGAARGAIDHSVGARLSRVCIACERGAAPGILCPGDRVAARGPGRRPGILCPGDRVAARGPGNRVARHRSWIGCYLVDRLFTCG